MGDDTTAFTIENLIELLDEHDIDAKEVINLF